MRLRLAPCWDQMRTVPTPRMRVFGLMSTLTLMVASDQEMGFAHLLWSIYVHKSVFVFMYVQAHMHVCGSVCVEARGQLWELFVLPQSGSLGWPGTASCSHLFGDMIVSACPHIQLFK